MLYHQKLLKRVWSGSYKDVGKESIRKQLQRYADYLMPYCVLPNVSKFKITDLQPHHPILERG